LGDAIESRNIRLFGLLLNLAPEEETREFINGDTLARHFAATINSGESEFMNAMLAFASSREHQLSLDDLFFNIVNYKPVCHVDATKAYDALSTMVVRYNAWRNLSGLKLRGGGNHHYLACGNQIPNVSTFLLQHTNADEWHAKDHAGGKTPIFGAI
jgi:hypothetical protein